MEKGPAVPTATAGASYDLGKYRLIAELGQGGMAEVFLAVVRGPAGFNKLVVIKQIRPQLADDPEFLGMFLDEARLAARLSHPNVVQTNEVGQEGNRYFIAMEYLDGQPLNRLAYRLQKGDGFSLSMHVKVLIDTLGGLHHAHELVDYDGSPLGVVHRDVTPHNVFVTYEGHVKVVDFGIAKALNSSIETRTGVLKGKISYMAPEQARGHRVDRRADIFAVGVMLWEAAVGRRLWKGVPDVAILQLLGAGEIPAPRSIRPEVPEKLEAIILKALSQRPDDRYATAAELQTALEGYLDESGERVHSRDVGKLISRAFEAERAKIKALIDQQVAAKPSSGVHSLPVIEQITHSGSADGPRSGSDGSSDKVEIVGAGASSSSYTAKSAPATAASKPAEGARRGPVAAIAVVGAAVLALGFWQVTKRSSLPAAAASTVEITVAANPSDAKVFLDDQALPGNPAKAQVPKDGTAHQVRVEAPGYASRTDRITFERDRAIDVTLVKDVGNADKQPSAAASDATTPEAPPTPAAPRRTAPPPARVVAPAPTPAPAPAPSVSPREVNCKPPFTIDSNGSRVPKPECL
jgi:serine/threonine-protein kinase